MPRNHPDSYALDVINSITGRGQSGTLFQEIRAKQGLAYEVNTQYAAEKDFGYFAVYLNTDKKNIDFTIKIIMDVFKNLNNVSSKELNDAKGFLEGQYILDNEDTRELADEYAYWQQVKDAGLAKDYIKNIRKVTKNDIITAAKKYLTKNYALAVVEQS